MRDALPNASFIDFTGTPIEKTDANTRAVVGDYVSIYDIQRAVADHPSPRLRMTGKVTVPIYYESRISNLSPEHLSLGAAHRAGRARRPRRAAACPEGSPYQNVICKNRWYRAQ